MNEEELAALGLTTGPRLPPPPPPDGTGAAPAASVADVLAITVGAQIERVGGD